MVRLSSCYWLRLVCVHLLLAFFTQDTTAEEVANERKELKHENGEFFITYPIFVGDGTMIRTCEYQ
jgi:hypothetical protein